jgi:uncharacterized protein YlxP (DUF503 family)
MIKENKKMKTISDNNFLKIKYIKFFFIMFICMPGLSIAQQKTLIEENEYIVVIDNTLSSNATSKDRRKFVEKVAEKISNQYDVSVSRVFSQAIMGFVVVSNKTAIDQIKLDPEVRNVEVEKKFYMNSNNSPKL